LWEYECIIIPGFGGMLATYRPAEMVLAEHIIYPPSKSVAFNEYLTASDGLLINYICQKEQTSYAEASEQVDNWVRKTKSLLVNNEEIYLPKIGCFHRDVEKKLRFEPDMTANYLSSAYGLRAIIAEPILRSKSADTIEIMEQHRASYALPRSNNKWAMAAVIILLLALGSVIEMMYQGVDIKPLNLNAASVLGFLEQFDKPVEIVPGPKASINKVLPEFTSISKDPVAVNVGPTATVDTTTEPLSTSHTATATTVIEETANAIDTKPRAGKKYYVIIGSFKRRANFQNAVSYLHDRHPNEEILEDTSLDKKRVGFYAGDTYEEALAKLKEARKDQQDYWLLVKR
jgi:cell division septation protein DedD